MSGHIIKRGKSWRLKFDIGTCPETGKRRVRYHTVKGGTKKEAAEKLTLLLAANVQGEYVAASKVMVGDFVSGRVTQWEDSGDHRAIGCTISRAGQEPDTAVPRERAAAETAGD
jgi:hypothetical protein